MNVRFKLLLSRSVLVIQQSCFYIATTGFFKMYIYCLQTQTGEIKKDSPALSLSSSNQLMAQWFKAMCQRDISWCA